MVGWMAGDEWSRAKGRGRIRGWKVGALGVLAGRWLGGGVVEGRVEGHMEGWCLG